jgi:serine/threonine protein kinase
VNHPNIAQLFGWSYEDGVFYLILKKGKSLEAANYDDEKFISELSSAIAFLNGVGIAHADIKPSNVVIIDDRVQLIDFGIAKFCNLIDDRFYFGYNHVC